MKRQNIFQIYADERGRIRADVPDTDKAIIALYDYIIRGREKGQSLFDILFSVTVHMAASEMSGEFLEQYVKRLREYVVRYRTAVMSGKDTPVS